MLDQIGFGGSVFTGVPPPADRVFRVTSFADQPALKATKSTKTSVPVPKAVTMATVAMPMG